jgi:uncharacterized protein YkwD
MQRMTRPYPRLPRTLVTVALTAAIALPVLTAGPTQASATPPPPPPGNITPASPARTTVEGYLRTWLNADRAARGLRPLRLDARLQDVARARAGALADEGLLSHTAAGNLTSQLASRGVQWYAWGEDLGWSGYSWGYNAARSLYLMWKHSPAHWALMMSVNFNYFGIGVGYRWTGGATYASIVFSDSRDHTRPVPHMVGQWRSGTTVVFRWRGADVALQRRTSGLRSFDVQYRVDGTPWRIIKVGTTMTSITLRGRAHGHYYWLRVRARDRAGNVSVWTSAHRIWVP